MAAMDEEDEEQVRIGGTRKTKMNESDDDEIQFDGTGSFKRLTTETMKMSPKVLRKAQNSSSNSP